MTAATEVFVEFERVGEVAVIRLNRPERMNAMGATMLGQLRDAYDALAQDDGLRVGIITGTGRGFCAGRDIKEGAAAGARLQDQATTANTDLFMENNSAKPLVAAVNGYAGGAGFYLGTRAVDVSVAAQSATFQIAEVPRGILHGWQTGFWGNLSRAAAHELAFGMKVSGQRAYDMGLVNRVCGDAAGGDPGEPGPAPRPRPDGAAAARGPGARAAPGPPAPPRGRRRGVPRCTGGEGRQRSRVRVRIRRTARLRDVHQVSP